MYDGQVGVGKVPSRQMLVRPRIFKHNGRIVGYETLQEYVDNNHHTAVAVWTGPVQREDTGGPRQVHLMQLGGPAGQHAQELDCFQAWLLKILKRLGRRWWMDTQPALQDLRDC